MRAMSRMSLIRPSRCWPALLIELRSCDCSSVSGPSMPFRMTREKPMIEFSGVRSSWLMLARNWLLSRSTSARRSAVWRWSSYSRADCKAEAAAVRMEPERAPCRPGPGRRSGPVRTISTTPSTSPPYISGMAMIRAGGRRALRAAAQSSRALALLDDYPADPAGVGGRKPWPIAGQALPVGRGLGSATAMRPAARRCCCWRTPSAAVTTPSG